MPPSVTRSEIQQAFAVPSVPITSGRLFQVSGPDDMYQLRTESPRTTPRSALL